MLQKPAYVAGMAELGRQTLPYAYASNDPINRIDRDGRYPSGAVIDAAERALAELGKDVGGGLGSGILRGVGAAGGVIGLLWPSPLGGDDTPRYTPGPSREPAMCGGRRKPPNLNDCLNACAGTENMREDVCRRLTDPWAKQLSWSSIYESEQRCVNACYAIFSSTH